MNPVDASGSKRSPLSTAQRSALALLRGYQLVFSPLFAGSCRFIPSCSEYAVEAVTRFGVVRGSFLAARRLARCQPFCAHGLDPVPDRQPRV
jgi:putative membrane protein insertion efficiency factor